MKNTSANRKQTGSQNPTRTTTQNMRYTTKCMTQSAFQKKILSLVQRAGDKVAEAMNIVDELGAITGINVHFERGGRSEQDDHRGEHSRHSNGNLNVNLGNRYDQSNHDEADDADEIDDIDDINYSDEIKEVTLPELADMVAEKTCFKPECTLCVLNTAFDIMDEQKLMLDLGTLSADTSEEDTEDTEEDADDSEYDEEDTDTDETYAECGRHDCDNCRHYDDCYGKSDSEYDDSGESSGSSESYGDDDYDDDSEDFNDGYDCSDDDEIMSQPTRNTRNSRNTSRSGREW